MMHLALSTRWCWSSIRLRRELHLPGRLQYTMINFTISTTSISWEQKTEKTKDTKPIRKRTQPYRLMRKAVSN
jgi:hypothetical protein